LYGPKDMEHPVQLMYEHFDPNWFLGDAILSTGFALDIFQIETNLQVFADVKTESKNFSKVLTR